MKYLTAYNTTLGSLTSNIKDLTHTIERYLVVDYPFLQRARITKDFTSVDKNIKAVFLTGMGTTEENVPNFAHSLLYNNQWLATDLRPYLTPDKDNNTFIVRNQTEYTLSIQRAILSGKWVLDDTGSLYNLKFAHDTFAAWLSETLGKRFGLNPNDQIKIQVLSYIYYTALFQNEALSSEDYDKLTIKIKSNQFITNELVESVRSSLTTPLASIEDFCKDCFYVTQNVRLHGLTLGVLMSVVGNNWYGHNSRELISAALEHPPTWIAMVHASLNLRSFKNTFVSNVVNKLDKRGAGDTFMAEYLAISQGYGAEYDR